MLKYDIIAETPEYTVVNSYEPKFNAVDYAAMTEGALEDEFLRILLDQGYELADFHSEKELVENLRRQLERLNDFRFSDDEWGRFFKERLAKPNAGIQEKTSLLQNGRALVDFKLDDNSVRNIYLFDKEQVHANRLQVMRQFCAEGKKRDRYDVTILVNGLPMVHVELKRAGGRLKEAFNQIERYQVESFSEGSRLFEFVQIFVISTGVETKYYSNTTRKGAVDDHNGFKKKSSASFEFTSYWADARNNVVHNLFDFAKTFFGRAAILNILAKYCVFDTDKKLLVMRPYQICAAERIVQKIRAAAYAKEWSGTARGGYVWHTTGSGKTLTSFKTAQLAAKIPDVDQVVFVVDRKDLDYQTMREYERFQQGAVVGTKSSSELGKILNSRDPSQKIVVTTIQKLSSFCESAAKDSVAAAKKFVFIFDECHRSQFGLMRDAIDAYFKKRLLYGFTGTPIFPENAAPLAPVNKPRKYRGKNALAVTTEQSFGERLHVYNIVDAIRDRNVLKFHVDFHDVAADMERELQKREFADADPETRASLYVNSAVEHILKTFDGKTMRNSTTYPFRTTRVTPEYLKRQKDPEYEESRLRGFNALLAASDVHAAIRYYKTFKEKLGDRFGKEFKIGIIFSASKNENSDAALGALDEVANNWIDDENNESAAELGSEELNFLESAIQDYNKLFNVSYSAKDSSFANYYKDVSMRVKNRELDLLIVVNMFLTGFDAPTLNTLWCDKNLRYHGLLQAFSRTNRILNATKSQGNIVCLRDLREEVDAALRLFGDSSAKGVVVLRPFEDYWDGYVDEDGTRKPGYVELTAKFQDRFEPGAETIGEKEEFAFIRAFGEILRLRNTLCAFDEFEGNDRFEEGDFNAYKNEYYRLKDKYQPVGDGIDEEGNSQPAPPLPADVVFEIELISQIDADVEYILDLIRAYATDEIPKDAKSKVTPEQILRTIGGNIQLRPKKELFEAFLRRVDEKTYLERAANGFDVREEWRALVDEEYERRLDALIQEERLKPAETRQFVRSVIHRARLGDNPAYLVTGNGTDVDKILPPVSIFAKKGPNRMEVSRRVVAKLRRFVEIFAGVKQPDAEDERLGA